MTSQKDRQDEDRSVVIGIARQLADGREAGTALDAARRRGWLDAAGEVTREGRDLARSLTAQRRTRTVFRGF
ncbi:MAG: hypothetical protein AAFR33_02575 [Pseudomonadota bacterium]